MVHIFLILYKHLCFLFFLYLYLFICLVVLDLQCCIWAFSTCSKWGVLLIAVHGLTAVASLVVEHKL